ncbi:MAG: glycosyltransferase family 87 protein [Bacteroidota bacterium]|nr:glycosyltransferase family 87 protein [Bacteroidota bacterium]MDP3147165.1 glycosyltransferase family 87 protein [Bacteroidota bacterium]
MSVLKNKIWLFLLFAAIILLCFFEARGKSDFYIFLSATGDLIRGANFYENKYEDGYHYFYSVLFALLLKPFYYLPFFWVKFCWLFFNSLIYLKLFQLLIKSKLVAMLNEKQKGIFILLVFIFSLRFFLGNIHSSQITILILGCSVFGLFFISNKKPISGAAILALGINIKLLPIVFLPYLIYRGYFKAFFFTVVFYFIYLFAPSLFLEHNYNISLLKTWLALINPSNQNHVLDVEERSFHGLSTLLSTLLVKEVPDVYALPLKRNIANVTLPTLSAILLLIRLLLVAFTLYFLKLKPLVKAKNYWQQSIEISYMLLLIPLIFPHQQHYAFLFMVPAFAIILLYLMLNYSGISKNKKIIIMVLLVLIYLSANLKLLLGTFNNYYEHYKILTYGALLLIPLLVWINKQIKFNKVEFF